MKSDQHWERHGAEQPYYSVVTRPEFKGPMTPESYAIFFKTGADYIESLLQILARHVDPAHRPGSALDFGCGVARLLVPLAKAGYVVTGIDISPSMLKEASHNLEKAGVSANSLHTTLDELPAGSDFDLVHSVIVFQHIPRERGIELADNLLAITSPSGIAVLHFTFTDRPTRHEQLGSLGNAIRAVCFDYPLLGKIVSKLRGKTVELPMLMQNYQMNSIFAAFHRRGFNQLHCRFTDHGMPGIIVIGQRNPDIEHPEMF